MPRFDAAPETVRLSLLGSLELHLPAGGDALPLLRQPKRVALLSYLALAEGFVPRESLQSLFWPELDASHARGSLRQSLAFIRRVLGSGTVVNRGVGEVGLAEGSVVCDATEFLAQAARGEWSGALELYRGDLLTGFHVDASQDFEAWLESCRSRLRAAAGDCAWSLASHAKAAGRFDEASFWAKRALSHWPFNEPNVRLLMVMLDEVGDLAGALRAYRGLSQWLSREFGASPSEETARVARALVQGPSPTGPQPERSRRRTGDRRRRPDRRTIQTPGFAPERRVARRRSGLDRRSGEDRRAQG
jgi:DNA-binding SARP family transcriptional activator